MYQGSIISSNNTAQSASITSSSCTKRPFQILGLQQVAVGSTDVDALKYLWLDIFGLNKVGKHTSEKENVMEDIVRLGPKNIKGKNGLTLTNYPVEVDLMCPLDENKSPKVHKPPLNHIGLWIDDLPAAVVWMTSKGVRFAPGGIRKGASGNDVTFIHPKGNDEAPIGGCGVLIELVQAPAAVIKAFIESE